jgi:hypothetical protein
MDRVESCMVSSISVASTARPLTPSVPTVVLAARFTGVQLHVEIATQAERILRRRTGWLLAFSLCSRGSHTK